MENLNFSSLSRRFKLSYKHDGPCHLTSRVRAEVGDVNLFGIVPERLNQILFIITDLYD